MPPVSNFALEEVRQISVAALRVRFTQYPRALDEDNFDDALNPDNYTLLGPNENYIIGAATVDGDRQSIDLYLAATLDLGEWQLTVTNVVQDTGPTLASPVTLPFIVTLTMTSDPLGHGAVNDEHANIIRRFLNPALKGPGWDSMIAALAAGDQVNADNARLAFDQLFLSSASGVYLDRRASDEGIERPKGVNMSDALFRRLAIIEKTSKLTQEAFLEVLEVFYGRDAVRASSTTAGAETWALQDEDDLSILFEERNIVKCVFRRGHFSRIGTATALEVAAAISRACRDAGNAGFAIATPDTITGAMKVRIYSGTLGLTSSVRVVGGRANTQLLFPTSLFEQVGISPFATWDIELSPETQGNLRFTMTAGTEYNLFLVQEGDLAYIYGDEFEGSQTNGTYEIEAVSVTYPGPVQWFEIENPAGIESLSVIQTGFADLMFFRPTRRTIYSNPRHVIVCENDDHLDIIIPATTEVVGRGPGTAAYLNGQEAMAGNSFSLIRTPDGTVTVDVDVSHGLGVGDQFIVDGVLPTGDVPSTDAGTPSGDFVTGQASGITNSSIQSTGSEPGTFEGVYHRAVRLRTGELMVVGGQTQVGAAISPRTSVAILSKTDEVVSGSGGRQVSYLWREFGSAVPPAPPSTGLVLWLRGDAGLTSVAGAATLWADQSGFGQDFADMIANPGPLTGLDTIDGIPALTCPLGNIAGRGLYRPAPAPGGLRDRNGVLFGYGPGETQTRTVMIVSRPVFSPTLFNITGGILMEMGSVPTWQPVLDLEDTVHVNGFYLFSTGWRNPGAGALQGPDTAGGAGGAYDGMSTLLAEFSNGFPDIGCQINGVDTVLAPGIIPGATGAGTTSAAILRAISGGFNFQGVVTEYIMWDYDLRTNPSALAQATAYFAARYPSLGM